MRTLKKSLQSGNLSEYFHAFATVNRAMLELTTHTRVKDPHLDPRRKDHFLELLDHLHGLLDCVYSNSKIRLRKNGRTPAEYAAALRDLKHHVLEAEKIGAAIPRSVLARVCGCADSLKRRIALLPQTTGCDKQYHDTMLRVVIVWKL